ncbi:lysophospholipid acyltransferase family protein [Polycladidibacter stylochi]|uniref:lysophospholipid acyltransferase family protein n=1 Tax=Polycladidibacter stylochi TaxID=1807766 RepID=UPI0008346C49|nr:1-acyl-sn-glycerol-3-phosphate acyltransferase [Pseudovibrio stylochi]
MARLRATIAIAILIMVTLLLILPQWLATKFKWPLQRYIPVLWHRVALRALGVRVRQVGNIAKNRPLLVTSNHSSWLDILCIGSTGPLSFVAKSEVSGWPIFGLFAKLQRTVFVNRSRRSETGKVAKEIAERMAQGDAMLLFAEGTSSNGNKVLPFRSALVGAVHHAMDVGRDEENAAYIQPLSISYTHFHGLPMGRHWRPIVAWYGDMELASHLWHILKEGGIDVTLHWGEPILLDQGASRKAITARLEQEVRQMTANALLNCPVLADDRSLV